MLRRIILIASIVANAAVGHLCMMPMAMAAEVPMAHDMDPTQDVMTPMIPMSHKDCADCPHHEEKQQPTEQSSSCVGHCLSHATNTNPTNVVTVANQLAVALPTAVPIVLNSAEQVLTTPEITPSPPPIATDTVVLTL